MLSDQDDSFVSISLDGTECEICLQDTGEALTTCNICAKFLTSGPVQQGFNQLPDLIHAQTQGHPSCFRKFHKLARRLSRASGENVRDQLLNFNSNNLGRELLLENIRSRVSKSNPGSRSGSPLLSGASSSGRLLRQDISQSDPQLDLQSQELRRSYTKYLFGKCGDDPRDSKQVPEKQPKHGSPAAGIPEAVDPVPGLTPKSAIGRKHLKPTEAMPKHCTKLSCQSNPQYLANIPNDDTDSYHGHMHASSRSQAETDCDPQRLKTRSNGDRESCALTTSNVRPFVALQESDKNDEGDLNGHEIDEKWRNVRHLSESQLFTMVIPDLKHHLQTLQEAVNRACSQLAQHLEEKDRLKGEVSSRHVTIQKLVERQTTLHH
ncbi:uncharacterized protein [Diadema antillarum]|uniref:uncharacterized protein n=1 Tax=Diadema antillarum TaxID=105358 RepID=UPI003A859BC4